MKKQLISNFEEACAALGLDPLNILPDTSRMPEKHRKAIEATAKLYVIAEALNEGWVPDWNDDDQYKYYPWFDLEEHKKNNPSGFRFGDSNYAVAYSLSAGGSRLCYRTRGLSDYAGKTFTDLYRDLME